MGYPTKSVKRRRHSRNMKLMAIVALSGAELMWRGGSPPNNEFSHFYIKLKDGTILRSYSPVKVLERAAEILGANI